MEPAPFVAVDVIAEHCAGFAAVTRDNLDAAVEHCPGWTVADLVHHLTDVHWFWTTIVGEHLAAPPDEARRPQRAPRDELVDSFIAGAARLVGVLRSADPASPNWTWAPRQQDAGFVIRHQVQEAAVHHWDASHAAGATLVIEPAVAADSIEEFLTVSLWDDSVPLDPPPPALGGELAMACSDIGFSWTVRDGIAPEPATFQAGIQAGVPTITASAADLLLWLYERVEVDTSAVNDDLLTRFREL